LGERERERKSVSLVTVALLPVILLIVFLLVIVFLPTPVACRTLGGRRVLWVRSEG
jgi:hypothetical protein